MNQIEISPRRLFRIRSWLIAALVIAIYIWSFAGLDFHGIQSTALSVSKAIVSGLFHPDFGYVYLPDGEDLLRGMLETLSIALLGTFISAVVCVPFAFWAASNMSRYRIASGSGKIALSLIRTFPEAVMAILFIKAVGPGSYAGVLALGLHSVGMLGKLFAEAVENLDMGPSEALKASGANRLQIIRYAVIPQVLPHFYSFTLYRFEINVRSATILGMIGAGGIGTPLIFALEGRSWPRVGIILLGIVVTVTLVDYLSGYLRRKII